MAHWGQRSCISSTHRSYIVSINKIGSFTSELVGIGKEELPISWMYRYELAKIPGND